MATSTAVDSGDTAPSSSTARGKRPATAASTAAVAPPADVMSFSETVGSGATTPSAPTRQKRILPSRSRRGGPGVGSCDVDVMILETRKRRLETEPLIPASTKFVLTTNSSLAAMRNGGGASDVVELNESAYGRYFERPEVQKAYKQQQIIQTPEFTQLPDDAVFGGRFRPRSEEEFADTSDAAYEKRHRKYETFEKRQRLREKEKLKHEHYKLKERIEQLRGMDYSAFLALPSAALGDSSQPEPESSSLETGIADLPGAHVNGAAAYNEGERRRKEMLDVALALEERYKVLLPPDRKWSEKKEKEKATKRESLTGGAAEMDIVEEEVEEVRVPPPPTLKKEAKSPVKKEVTLTHRAPPPLPTPAPEPSFKHDSDGESEVDFEERERLRSKQLKLRIKFPARPTSTPTDPAQPSPSPSKKSTSPVIKLNPSAASSSVLESISPAQVKNISAKSGVIIRSKDGKFLPKNRRYITDPAVATEFISAPPALASHPRKRVRTELNSISRFSPLVAKVSPTSHTAVASSNPSRTCVLMVAAMRSSLLPNSRKTQRNVSAFGTRVPQEIEEVRDFQIPQWLHSPEMRSDDGHAEVLEHGSAYGYSVSVNGNRTGGIGSVSMNGEEMEYEDDEGTKEEDVDQLMDWQSGEGDSEGDVIPPIAKLGDK
ncbi:hypothetical protein BXZ70DRAFT_928494 [Cristinia sonorae]|uniref:PEHE domain-containing protein n=1 Tax=Cristinia sonorae TaxID=1940300 RepID=A0A8K0UQZ6_9AGAR|nr:hypothetical protein BXZ70DRAFT_928494 [Cristinia sonorae]